MPPLHPSSTPPQPRPPRWDGAAACLTLWHGTSEDNLSRILAGVDPAKGERPRDFGRGFYTTTYRTQAMVWAEKFVQKARLTGTPATVKAGVVWFRVPLARFAPLHSLAFVRPEPDNELFWSLVCECRGFPPGSPPDLPEHTHRYRHPDGGTMYDVVSGPVAAAWAVKGKRDFPRQVYAEYDQYSFHTPAAAAIFNNLLLTGKPDKDYGSSTFAVP